MSGKSEISNTSTGTSKTSIEKALKEVFYIHRNTVKEFQGEIGEWISRCEDYQEENKILKEKLEKHEKEKGKLEEKLKSKTNTNCVMCEHLRESIQVVKDAYNLSIQEKDNMIQFLKEQLSKKCEYTVPLTDLSNKNLNRGSQSKTPQKSSTNKSEKTDSQKKKHSPDSTVNSANKKTDKTNKQLIFNQSDEDSDEQSSKSGDKLRLARKNKRSRYKEDISPTNKKIKVHSIDENSSENGTTIKDDNFTSGTKTIQSSNNTSKEQSSKGKLPKSKTSPRPNFAPETCFDRSASLEDDDEDDGPMVVPETLGMETYTSSEEEPSSEEEITQKAKAPSSLPMKTVDAFKNINPTPTKKSKSSLKSSFTNQIENTSTPPKKAMNQSLRSSSRNYADHTTDILNSPDSDMTEDEVSGLQPTVSASETDNIEDELGDSGYTSRLEKSKYGSQPNESLSKNKLSKTKLRKNSQEVNKGSEKGIKSISNKKFCDEIMQYEPISPEPIQQPLKLDVEKAKNSGRNSSTSPIFTKPSDKTIVNTSEIEESGEQTSPLLLQSGKSIDEAPKRSLRTKKATIGDKQTLTSKKSSQKTENTCKSKKKASPIDIDLTENSNLKQTTLSQVFTSSPKQSAPPFETDEERQRMQEAIKQSLLEFHNTSQEYKKKKSDLSNATFGEIFKKPLSPKTTPRKRVPSGKRSPMASPDKYFSSPQKANTSFDPDDTVGPSPNSLNSLPIIPLRRSPRKSVTRNSLSSSRRISCNQSLDDMDETIAPSPSVLDSMGKQVSEDESERQLNRSIAPDVPLTQYCEDSESCDPYRASPELKKNHTKAEGRKTRRTLDLSNTDESQTLPSSSKSHKFGTRRGKKVSTDTQNDLLEDQEGTFKDPMEYEETVDEDDNLPVQHTSFDSSFDKVPSKKGPDFAHVKVVKKQDERRKLKGHSCKECYEYYKLTGMSEEEIQDRIQDCSRHRADYIPPSTPEHFWSIGFPDTQECQERGYAQVERNTKPSTYRRKRQLQRKFKSKDETTVGKGEDNGNGEHEDLLFS